MDQKEILRRIEKSKDNYSKGVEKQMVDRIRYGAKETLDYFARREARGYTPQETLKDIEKSKYK
jgi:hypothetical protein